MYPYYHNYGNYHNYYGGYNPYGGWNNYGYGGYGYGPYFYNPWGSFLAAKLMIKLIKFAIVIIIGLFIYDYHETGKPVSQQPQIIRNTIVNSNTDFRRTHQRAQLVNTMRFYTISKPNRERIMNFYQAHPGQRLRIYNVSRQCLTFTFSD